MHDDSAAPEEGATRFAADGSIEVFSGTSWDRYEPLADDGLGIVFKGGGIPPLPDSVDPAADEA